MSEPLSIDDDQSRVDAAGVSDVAHTLDVTDAVLIFREAGFPYTERTVQRYCQGTRGFSLDCMKVATDAGQRWKVSEPSIRTLIEYLRNNRDAAASAGRDQSRPDATSRDQSRQEEAGSDTVDDHAPTEEAAVKIEKLEQELRELEITNRMFERFNAKLLADEQHIREALEEKSYTIGALEADRRHLFELTGGDPSTLKTPLPPPRDRSRDLEPMQARVIRDEPPALSPDG